MLQFLNSFRVQQGVIERAPVSSSRLGLRLVANVMRRLLSLLFSFLSLSSFHCRFTASQPCPRGSVFTAAAAALFHPSLLCMLAIWTLVSPIMICTPSSVPLARLASKWCMPTLLSFSSMGRQFNSFRVFISEFFILSLGR